MLRVGRNIQPKVFGIERSLVIPDYVLGEFFHGYLQEIHFLIQQNVRKIGYLKWKRE
jgi:hypothetical protein